MEQSLGLAASIFGVAMACSPLLQVWRIWERKSSDDVSWILFGIITVGAGLWAAYGVVLRDLFLIVPNAIGVFTNFFLVSMIFTYRSRDIDSDLVRAALCIPEVVHSGRDKYMPVPTKKTVTLFCDASYDERTKIAGLAVVEGSGSRAIRWTVLKNVENNCVAERYAAQLAFDVIDELKMSDKTQFIVKTDCDNNTRGRLALTPPPKTKIEWIPRTSNVHADRKAKELMRKVKEFLELPDERTTYHPGSQRRGANPSRLDTNEKLAGAKPKELALEQS